MPDNLIQEADVNTPACDNSLSRKEFLTKLVQKAALAGSLVAAPKIIDKFLVPPALAINSTQSVHDSTQHFHDSHAPFRNPPSDGSGPTGSPSSTDAKKDAADFDSQGWG